MRAVGTHRRATDDPAWTKAVIIGVVMLFLALVLVLPLVAVFVEALRKGVGAALAAISNPDALAAVKLTLLTALIAVPFNAVFGLCRRCSSTPRRTPTSRSSGG